LDMERNLLMTLSSRQLIIFLCLADIQRNREIKDATKYRFTWEKCVKSLQEKLTIRGE